MTALSQEKLAAIRSVFADAPAVANLGIEIVAAARGRCEAALQIKDDHLQHLGVVHGGVITTLAGHAALGAAISVAESGARLVSPNFTVNLVRAARAGRLVAEASVVTAGTTLILLEVDVYGVDTGTRVLVAKTTFTFTRSPVSPIS